MLWVLIGNPENRRVQMMQQALHAQGSTFHTLAYHQLLMAPSISVYISSQLSQYKAAHWLIRIDSPGENEHVENGLIALGANKPNAEISAAQALTLNYDQGRIRYARQWYAGFCKLLNKIEQVFNTIKIARSIDISYLNTPTSIQQLFDKPRIQQCLAKHSIATPGLLPDIQDYEQLKQSMINQRCYRVFVKLNYGSSASGVVALQIKPDGCQVHATTSVEYVPCANEYKLYNSLTIRHYNCEKTIANIINELIRQGCYIERWVPKARIERSSYDLRIVVINQQACHSVVRLSQTPLTNLHLGNQRGDANTLPPIIYSAACTLATVAANSIDGANNIGVDVLVTHGSYQPKIIELNAFGDLLPGILYKGLNTYEHQCQQLHQKVTA